MNSLVMNLGIKTKKNKSAMIVADPNKRNARN